MTSNHNNGLASFLFFGGIGALVYWLSKRLTKRNPPSSQLPLWSEQQERAIRSPMGSRFIVKRRKPTERSSAGRFRHTAWKTYAEYTDLEEALRDARRRRGNDPWQWQYAVFHKGQRISKFDHLESKHRGLRK